MNNYILIYAARFVKTEAEYIHFMQLVIGRRFFFSSQNNKNGRKYKPELDLKICSRVNKIQ